MKILVIGGSYFLGKAFVKMSSGENELFVINRGSRPLQDERVRQYCADRHDVAGIRGLKLPHFDAVVDFCAYSPGDIRLVFDSLAEGFEQYVFISTVDVYRRETGVVITEEHPFEDRDFGGEAGAYILGKAALERELRDMCQSRGCRYTSIRPAIIYGEDNYAPRESMYFNWICQAGQIRHPSDATGFFQLVYVGDVAGAVKKVCGLRAAYDGAFNVCPEDTLDYDGFYSLLCEASGMDIEQVGITVTEILERQIPLPFPLTRQESCRYSTDRAKEVLGLEYTPALIGMKKAYAHYVAAQQM